MTFIAGEEHHICANSKEQEGVILFPERLMTKTDRGWLCHLCWCDGKCGQKDCPHADDFGENCMSPGGTCIRREPDGHVCHYPGCPEGECRKCADTRG